MFIQVLIYSKAKLSRYFLDLRYDNQKLINRPILKNKWHIVHIYITPRYLNTFVVLFLKILHAWKLCHWLRLTILRFNLSQFNFFKRKLGTFIVLVGSSDYMCDKDKKAYVFKTLSNFKTKSWPTISKFII